MRSRSREPAEPTIVVVTDTTVLVNLIHIDRTDLFARIPGYEFVLPDEVVNEVADKAQQMVLQTAIAGALLRRISITDVREIALKAELTSRFGEGESACLALARTHGYAIATDDARAIRTARETLGEGRILTTPGLLVLAIRAELMTVDEADDYKQVLEGRRFLMSFKSFRDIA